MGGMYGSVQVRCEDRAQVTLVAGEVAKDHNIRLLVGPLLRGWVGIYPEKGGQDQTIGEDVARRLKADVLHILVHGDDVMAYWFWRGGDLVDSYWSRPGYFGEEQRPEQEAMAGRPEVFSDLFPGKVEKLRELLRRDQEDRHGCEEGRLADFGKLLGIANLVTAYEYLKDGETEGVTGWRKFKELPADEVARQKQAAKELKDRIKALKKTLKAAGLLLTEKRGDPSVIATTTGFVVVWPAAKPNSLPYQKSTPESRPLMELYSPPWTSEQEIPIDLSPSARCLARDSAGLRISAWLNYQMVVYSTQDWHIIREVAGADHAITAALSGDGTLLARSCRAETVVTNVDTGDHIMTVPIAGNGLFLGAMVAHRPVAVAAGLHPGRAAA